MYIARQELKSKDLRHKQPEFLQQRSACVPTLHHSSKECQGRSFEVASFATAVDRAWKNSGNHHNPTRQRGILANTAEAKKRNPSLTRRVGIGTNSQLQKADLWVCATQATSTILGLRTSNRGSIPSPGSVPACINPFTRWGAPEALLTLT